MVETLKEKQPELGITDEEALCVKVAGLCHDLGIKCCVASGVIACVHLLYVVGNISLMTSALQGHDVHVVCPNKVMVLSPNFLINFSFLKSVLAHTGK